MVEKKQYYGFDVAKLILALLVALRHIIQVFFTAESRGHLWVSSWLSNLAVPTFFVISGFFLFQKIKAEDKDTTIIRSYCKKVLKLYVTWCVIYLPIDWYNWYHGDCDILKGILTYLHSFLFSSSIVQLWYLPALAVSATIVWFLYTHHVKIWQILIIGSVLFVIGCIGDNWYLNEQLPHQWYLALLAHNRIFITMRNGLYYGVIYMAIALWFAKNTFRLPQLFSWVGFFVFLGLMYVEVCNFHNINLIFSAVPTVICLIMALTQLQLTPRKLYPRLRGMSEWIYLSHFYFFYFFAWTLPYNPIPANNKTITVMLLGSLVVVSYGLVRLSETNQGKFLKKFI